MAVDRLRPYVELAAATAMIIAAGVVIWSNIRPRTTTAASAPDLEGQLVSFSDAALKGSESARTGMLVFSDFECPYCGLFARTAFRRLDTKYIATGQLRAAFRHLPLEAVHPDALFAARAAECAGREEKFWQLHDLLFAHQQDLSSDAVSKLAIGIGLGPTWSACTEEQSDIIVARDLKEAETLGITSTPVVLIGTIDSTQKLLVKSVIAGAAPVGAYESAIDKLTQAIHK